VLTSAEFSPVFTTPRRSCSLSNDTPAIQLIRMGNEMQFGPIVTLGQGNQIELCDDGFDKDTVKVRCQGQFYFVFLKDLEPLKMSAASAS
jgi:hypothetical protein